MISVEAALTCSAETVRFFSRAAATRAPLARWLALRSSPPDPCWMARMASSAKSCSLIPAILKW